jgi:hypothetical protein
MRDGLRVTLFEVSERVGRPVHELEDVLSVEDLLEYRSFWRIRADAEAKAMKKARGAQRRGTTR